MTDDGHVVLRPLGTPLPLGFLALAVATAAFAALQLQWLPPTASTAIALAALLFTAPVQLAVSVLAFLARDAVAGTGMGLLAGTWAAVGAGTLAASPRPVDAGLGVVLLAAAACLAVPAVAASAKPLAAAVIGLSAVRFAVTGIYQLSGPGIWASVAGWVGLALAVLALYAALAFLLEDTRSRAVLPLARHGSGAPAGEPGVRAQL